MTTFKDLPYRACVGLLLLNKEGKIFIGERIDTPGAWQMPQGGIDEGESIEQAALRELQEETGTDKAVILKILPHKLKYDLPPHLRGRLWAGKFQGQEQSWVVLHFLGDDNDINIHAHDPAEFRSWLWSEPDKILDLIVPFKMDTYKAVFSMMKDDGLI